MIPGSSITGSQTITGDTKVNGDVVLNDGATLTFKGRVLWIDGNLDFQHPNGSIQLDSSLGPNSAFIIVSDVITFKNNADIRGSGDPKSFAIVIDTKNDPINPSISTENNTSSAVFYAPHGIIDVVKNDLNNATAYLVHLEHNTNVTYNVNLGLLAVPPSNPTPPSADPTSWREL